MVVESATKNGLILPSDARMILSESCGRSPLLPYFDPASGSGSETRVRLFLQRARFAVRTQVYIQGLGYVDLLAGKSLIIECDSEAHHSDPTEDRRRDLVAHKLGYTTLRLSYHQIHYTWQDTQKRLLAILRTGKHLEPPQPCE